MLSGRRVTLVLFLSVSFFSLSGGTAIQGPAYIGYGGVNASVLFEGYTSPPVFNSGVLDAEVTILTPRSTPTRYGEWSVRFRTTGVEDLLIVPYDGTYLDRSIEFTSLKCGDEVASVSVSSFRPIFWVDGVHNGRVFASEYSCDEASVIAFRVLETGKHYIQIEYGGDVGFAENYADCTGSDTAPCNMCDVASMTGRLRKVGSVDETGVPLNYVSETGVCTGAPGVTENYSAVYGYQYCPSEGSYEISANASAEGGTNYSIESGGWTPAYTVDFDGSADWCACGFGAGSWNVGGAYVEGLCCGDDIGEAFGSRVCAPGACTSDPADSSCLTSASTCLYNDVAYVDGSRSDVDGDGDQEVCSSGVWRMGCSPPILGDWIVQANCTYSISDKLTGNLILPAGRRVTMTSTSFLSMDLSTNYILIYPGATLILNPGSTIGYDPNVPAQ